MEVICQIQAPTALPQEQALVPTVQKDVWAQQVVMMFWKKGETLAVSTLDPKTFQLVT
jgi:hypothetical protein